MPFKGLVQLSLKNAQHENCELHFIWGKMKTLAQETAFQIALRNCSKEVGGRSAYSDLGADIIIKKCGAFLDMRRCNN